MRAIDLAIRMGLVALAASAACASTPKGEGQPGPLVEVDRLLPKAKSLRASAIAVRLKVMNPGSRAVAVRNVSYSITSNLFEETLEGTVEAASTLEAKQAAEVEFTVAVPLPEEEEAYRELLARGTIPIDVKGSVEFGDGTRVPFDRAGAVATPALPKFVVHDAQAARYGSEGIDVTFFLRLINENVFPITVQAVEYTVAINGKEMKSEQAGIGARLPQNAVEEYEVSVVLDAGFEGSKRILEEARLTYTVSGKVSMPEIVIPFEHVGDIDLGSSE